MTEQTFKEGKLPSFNNSSYKGGINKVDIKQIIKLNLIKGVNDVTQDFCYACVCKRRFYYRLLPQKCEVCKTYDYYKKLSFVIFYISADQFLRMCEQRICCALQVHYRLFYDLPSAISRNLASALGLLFLSG